MSIQTYAARWVLPIDAPPMEHGEVVVEDGRISAVRAAISPQYRDKNRRDFGEAVLLPGLVNAHTHWEYTALRGFLEDVPFFPWVRALYAAKASLNAEDWLWSSRLGALESLAAGTTTIGDNTDAGVTMTVAAESGIRAIVYQEVFGIDHRQPVPEILADLQAKITMHQRLASERVRVGVSPHALYTVRPELMDALNKYVAQEHLPTSIHIAESGAESALTEFGTGEFAEMFARRGIEWTVPHATPTQYADTLGVFGANTLAVHCVHQTPEDIALLAHSRSAIVHCPKSNAKLGAGIAPLASWLKTDGLRIALGTDSAVSNNTLDLWEEMRFALLMQRAIQEDVESVTAAQLLRMATLGGAEALGRADQVGSLTVGKRADLIAVRLSAPHTVPATDPYAALLYSARADDVCFTLCDGEPVYDNGHWPTLDAPAILNHVHAIRSKLLAL
jgi:cytosine/adenosine deaminase-related metal-dependent hydrolase